MNYFIKQLKITIFLLLFIITDILAIASDGTYSIATFSGTGTSTLSNTDFLITGTGGGISKNFLISEGVAFINDTTDNVSWVVTFSVNNSTTGSFELSDVNFKEYLDHDNYTNLSLVGQVLGGGTVSSTNTVSPGSNGVKDTYTGTTFGMGNFSGVQLTSFEFRFDSTIAGGEDMELNSFTILNAQAPVLTKPEPTNHPTSFVATANSTSQITTAWTDSAVGSQAPDGYMVMCSTTDSFSDPVDTTAQSDDSSCADGSGVQNIAHGTQTVAWTGLNAGTQYYYKIFPYTNSGGDINYKTDGTPLTADATTDSGYSISIEKTTEALENNTGSPTDAVFTVRVTPANTTGGAITGNIAYTGTATNGTDYATGVTTFSIPDNSSIATITLDTTEDTLVEGTETIIATISSPSTGSLGTASVSANMTDDDSYSLAIAKTSDGKEDIINTVFTVTVTPQNDSGSAITGNIAYTGTATNGTDYATGATTFSIPNGSATATITLLTTTDTLVEGTETAIATISGASEGSISTSVATANIIDNDSYSISIEKTTEALENNTGSPTDAVFTVRVTPANTTGGAITGNIAYTGTATNGTDYATGATSFSIADGSSTAVITLDITEDTLVEGTETISATISSPSIGSLGTASVSANITDDESYSLAITKTTDGAENGSGNPTDAVFIITVTPQNDSGGTITGNIAYTGTAVNGTDYATGATSFSIGDGSSTATITLDVTEDTDDEGTETVIATISNASEGSIDTASATANITDDDGDDTTPDSFYFTSLSGEDLQTSYMTREVTITGISDGTPISIVGGEYNINGQGGLVSTAGTINNNDKVKVRVMSSPNYSTTSTANLTIGTVTESFNVTTKTAPVTPPSGGGSTGGSSGGGSTYTPPTSVEPTEPEEEEKPTEIETKPIEITPTTPIVEEPIVRSCTSTLSTTELDKPIYGEVTTLYIATFGRAPDSNGLCYWVNESGLDINGIAKSFFDQEETQQKYPEGYDNYDFIVSVYQQLFRRDPDQAGGDYWLAELDRGAIERSEFILAIMNGATGDDALMLANQTTVGSKFVETGSNDVAQAQEVMQNITSDASSMDSALESMGGFVQPSISEVSKLYKATFNRDPDEEGLEYWVNQSGLDINGIAKSFFDQEETQDRYPEGYSNHDFIVSIYNNLFNREPDEAGLEYWEGELSSYTIDRSLFILTVINGATGEDALLLEEE